MSQEQPAFDDWLQAAQQIQKQQAQNNDITNAVKQEEKPQVTEQKESKKILDPKEILKNKIKSYKQIKLEQFQNRIKNSQQQISISQKNRQYIKNPLQLLLKSDKDFINYAKQVADRIKDQVKGEDNIEDAKIFQLVDQLFMMTYNSLVWDNFPEIQSKVKVAKNERKIYEKKQEKLKKKEKITNKQQDETQFKIKQTKKEDEIFGGAGLSSKEQEDALKNKIIVVKEPETKQNDDDDDDDFM